MIRRGSEGQVKVSFGMKKKRRLIKNEMNVLNGGGRPSSDKNSDRNQEVEQEDPEASFVEESFSNQSRYRVVPLPTTEGEPDNFVNEAFGSKCKDRHSIPQLGTVPTTNSKAAIVGLFGEDADYELEPIEGYGLAVLRGCGWKDGDGIGKTNKQLIPPYVPTRRPAGLGLGAVTTRNKFVDKSVITKAIPDEPDAQNFKVGCYVKVVAGRYRDYYGKVVALNEDLGSRFMVLMKSSQSIINFQGFFLLKVDREEYQCNGKSVDKHDDKRDNKKIDAKSAMKSVESDMQCTSKDYEQKKSAPTNAKRMGTKHDESYKPNAMWLRPNLRVRFVSHKFKGGLLFNKKFRVVDAPDRHSCTLEDSSDSLYYNIHEDWLETVVPKYSGSKVMIVGGKFSGQLAIMEQRDDQKGRVTVRIIDTEEVIRLSYYFVCEWLGDTDE